MRLNAKHKQAIIIGLIEEATKNNAPAMKKAAATVHKLWVRAVNYQVTKSIPDLSVKRWAELIQTGAMRPFMTEVRVTKADPRPQHDTHRSSSPVGYGWLNEAKEITEGVRDDVCKALYGNYDLQGLRFTKYAGGLKFTYVTGIPAMPNLNRLLTIDLDLLDCELPLTDPDKELERLWVHDVAPVLVQIDVVKDKMAEIILAAIAYHAQLTDILASISTDKQLEENFPEAVKYLPRPVKVVKNEVADVNLINKARKMLLEGIPN